MIPKLTGLRQLRVAGRPGLSSEGVLGVGGRAPTMDELAGMTDAQLDLLMRRAGISDVRATRMREDVARSLRQLADAEHPEADLIRRSLDRAERVVRKHLASAAKEALRARERDAYEAEDDLVWQGVMGDGLICEKCEALDGEIHTSSEWDAYGRPGDPDRTCGWP